MLGLKVTDVAPPVGSGDSVAGASVGFGSRVGADVLVGSGATVGISVAVAGGVMAVGAVVAVGSGMFVGNVVDVGIAAGVIVGLAVDVDEVAEEPQAATSNNNTRATLSGRTIGCQCNGTGVPLSRLMASDVRGSTLNRVETTPP